MDYGQLHTDIVADGGYLSTSAATASRMRNFTRTVAVTEITPVQFMRRFTTLERVAIRASADPVIADFLKLLESSTGVDLTASDLSGGIDYMAALATPLVAASRKPDLIAAEAQTSKPYKDVKPWHVERAQSENGG